MLCLKVPKTEGEEVRKKLLDAEVLDNRYKIAAKGEYLLMPLKGDIPEGLEFYQTVECEPEERMTKVGDYRELLVISEELKQELPTSYDIVGDIVMIKIPGSLEQHKGEIGRAIIDTHKKVKTVMDDKGVIGDFRLRDVEVIAGESKTTTIYREYGIELEVDVAKSYFSPRLATERWRVVNQVHEGETVLDMFAGLGPFSILIAKHVKVKQIHAIDINPDAIELLKINTVRNSVDHVIDIHLGDASKIAPKIPSDRVIMNLPHSAGIFIKPALDSLENGGMIHYYEILPEEKAKERALELVEEINKLGKQAQIVEQRIVRTYSPMDVHMAFDILVS